MKATKKQGILASSICEPERITSTSVQGNRYIYTNIEQGVSRTPKVKEKEPYLSAGHLSYMEEARFDLVLVPIAIKIIESFINKNY